MYMPETIYSERHIKGFLPDSISRFEYQKEVGYALVDWLAAVFEEIGFSVWINTTFGNGPDLKIYFNGELHIIAEVWNWGLGNYPKESRLQWTINNLTSYSCLKLLIVSCLAEPYRRRVKRECEAHEIHLVELGYQINPYSNYFGIKEQILRNMKLEYPDYLRSWVRLSIMSLLRANGLFLGKETDLRFLTVTNRMMCPSGQTVQNRLKEKEVIECKS